MNVQEWDQIVDSASVLLNRLDKHGVIFDSSDDEMLNNKIVRSIDENKMDIISILYNILNTKKRL